VLRKDGEICRSTVLVQLYSYSYSAYAAARQYRVNFQRNRIQSKLFAVGSWDRPFVCHVKSVKSGLSVPQLFLDLLRALLPQQQAPAPSGSFCPSVLGACLCRGGPLPQCGLVPVVRKHNSKPLGAVSAPPRVIAAGPSCCLRDARQVCRAQPLAGAPQRRSSWYGVPTRASRSARRCRRPSPPRVWKS
jgi:hypothetical protein